MAPIDKAIETITTRKDGADFVANGLVRIYRSPSPLVTPELRQEIKTALLGFKYWVDEPGGKDLLSMWNENHPINYHAAQFLAGQLFPEETFTNNGKPGRWHAAAGRARGCCAGSTSRRRPASPSGTPTTATSTPCAALLNLAELAKDPRVARRAAMLLDVMFFDMAIDSFRGSYGTSHGRTYAAGHRRRRRQRGHHRPAADRLGHGRAGQAGQRRPPTTWPPASATRWRAPSRRSASTCPRS